MQIPFQIRPASPATDDDKEHFLPATDDDKEHFFVEPGRLFRLQSQLASDNVAGTLLQSLQGQTSQDTATKERTHNETIPEVPGLWRDLWNENHWEQPRQEEDRVNGQLFRNEHGQYVLKVTEGQ